MIIDKLKAFGGLLKQAGQGFMRDKVPKLSASLSYYTLFSLGPVLLVVIFFADLFYGEDAIKGALFGQLKGLVGEGAAAQIQTIIQNAAITGSTLTTVISFVTLIIGATSVFTEIQDSINSIWKLKIKEGASWKLTVKSRLTSFSLVVSLGFLLLVSLILNSLIEGLMGALQRRFPEVTVVALYLINLAVTLLITSTLFGIIFKVLPDARVKWKDVAVGSIFTAVLFMLGKFGITYYITSSKIGTAYGTAGSVVILLLWVYYSSMILYFGAEFTKAYALKFGDKIRPKVYATTFQQVNIESDSESIQENETDEKRTQAALERAKKKRVL
ncbi:YihY/virulence factor BrkB family protein [Segetibacter sp. 3557_3]|uniref:YihY/virulence factor BrkB family protein n=1 Tax=Segetibacter sp. 3557_3 TaxID=2547429 RepID=UPI00105886F5|nr:YihY/virulence factor BrkB family protein [Segetibacter sp. 3557_3]TDH21661.1 YihY/virulence factor BrkB family protein [Segetibacter sp. 3557_3]